MAVVNKGANIFAKGKPRDEYVERLKQSRAGTASKNDVEPTYGAAASEDWNTLKDGTAFGSKGGMDQFSKTAAAFKGNLQRDAVEEGTTVMGLAGQHAIRGAAWGAVGGGTIESMQGGSFWDGAKQGAVNGAVGWTGYRMAMRGTGATSLNPFAGGNRGLMSSASTMGRAFSKDADVSSQAVAIMNNRQLAGVAQGVMNTRKAAAAAQS